MERRPNPQRTAPETNSWSSRDSLFQQRSWMKQEGIGIEVQSLVLPQPWSALNITAPLPAPDRNSVIPPLASTEVTEVVRLGRMKHPEPPSASAAPRFTHRKKVSTGFLDPVVPSKPLLRLEFGTSNTTNQHSRVSTMTFSVCDGEHEPTVTIRTSS